MPDSASTPTQPSCDRAAYDVVPGLAGGHLQGDAAARVRRGDLDAPGGHPDHGPGEALVRDQQVRAAGDEQQRLVGVVDLVDRVDQLVRGRRRHDPGRRAPDAQRRQVGQRGDGRHAGTLPSRPGQAAVAQRSSTSESADTSSRAQGPAGTDRSRRRGAGLSHGQVGDRDGHRVQQRLWHAARAWGRPATAGRPARSQSGCSARRPRRWPARRRSAASRAGRRRRRRRGPRRRGARC